MPIQYPDFRADPNGTPKISGWPGFIESAAKGYQLSQMPQQIRDKQALQQAQLQKTQQENQFYPQQAQANLELTRAQANKENSPYGDLSGDAGNAFKLEQLKAAAAQNPQLQPLYDQAKKAFDLDMSSKQSMVDYRGLLTNYAPQRFGSPMSKLYSEMADVQDGFRPGSNRQDPLTPEEQQKLSGQYQLKLLKDTTDSQLRERNLFGHNLDITLERIDPQALTQYSGIPGQAKLQQEKAMSQFGKQSPEYDEYIRNITDVTTAAKQLRQYLKDTVQPSGQEKLSALTMPSTWEKNPQQALAQFNEFKALYGSERKTFSDATKSPDVYTESTPSQIPNSTTGNNLKAAAGKATKPTLTKEQALQMAKERGYI